MQPKTYRYRSHVRKMPRAYIGASVVGALGTLALVLFGGSWTFFAAMTGFLTVELYVLGIWLKRLASAELTLHADHLEFRNHRRHVRMRYDEMEKIAPRSVPYMGGGLHLKTRREKVNVMVTVEGITDFVQELKRRLDSNHVVYDRSKLFSFLKTAATADHSWARMQGRGKSAGVMFAVMTLAPIAFVFTNNMLILTPLAIGMGAYGLAELLHVRRIAKMSDEVKFSVPPRDAKEEGRTLLRAALGVSVAVAPFAVAYLAF